MDKAHGSEGKSTRKDRRAEVRVRQRLEHDLSAGQEHPLRWRERLGETSFPRPAGPLIWIHCRDDDAALGYLSLIHQMRHERDDLNYLITTSGFDPQEPLLTYLPDRCSHQFLPFEEGVGVEPFLDHWQPDCCLWLDSTLRNPVICSAAERGFPLFMADATLVDEKQNKLRWFAGSTRKSLGCFEHLLAVDGRSARNMKRQGVRDDRIEVLGHLQEGAPPLDCVQSDREAMAALLAARPIWLAAGITREEEQPVLHAQKQVSRRSHRLLLVLVPDDKARGPELATELEQAAWTVALRSAGQEPAPETQIYIADHEGEMGLWLRLSPLVFMGHTLGESDGNAGDPYQATALGSAVLHGPRYGVFARHYARLQKAGAARQVSGEKVLALELETLLAPDKVAEMARAAWEVSTSGAQATDRIIELVLAALDARGV